MKKRIIFAIIVILIFTAFAMAVNMRFPVRYLDIVTANAGEFEPSFILAVIMAESSFREEAVSRRGARGLMQIMPATAAELAVLMGLEDYHDEDVWKPNINIAMGCFYLNRLFERYGCAELALAAYNAGQGNVNQWLADPDYSSCGRKLDSIPFPETENYIERVLRNQRIYNLILTLTGRNKR